MRQGVTFHNGQPVTADDAWKSIQRVANPDEPLSAGGQLSTIIDFQSTKVVDDKTLQLVLNTPYAILDTLLAEYTLGIIPGGEFDPTNPIGTGAFAYKSFEAGKTSTFTKYADYWGDAAFVDELQIQDFADDNAKVNALQANQIQTLDNLPYNLIDTIKGAGGGVLIADGGAWVPFTMRVDQAPFDDVKVRQAMRLIVDRQAMIDQTLSGYGILGNDMYAPLDVNYASDLPQREQDIDQAKSLLASAGAGRAPGRAVHRRRHRLGGRPGREPLRRAGQGGRRRGQGHQEDRVLRRRLPDLRVRPGLLEHPQLHPAGRGRHLPAGPGRHLQRDALGQRRTTATWSTRRPRSSTRPSARTCSTRPRRSSTTRAAYHLGLPPAGRRLRRQREGPRGRASTSRSATTSSTRCRSRDMTQVATLPDPLEEVAPPRGASGGTAWALWLAAPPRPGRPHPVAGLDPGLPGHGGPRRPGAGDPRARLRLQRRPAPSSSRRSSASGTRSSPGTSTGSAGCSPVTPAPRWPTSCRCGRRSPTAWSTRWSWCCSRHW